MHVFVCHAAPDRDAAVRLRADLAQIGRQVALDRGEPTGPDWWGTVLARIRRCTVFVFVVSPDSVRSPGCRAELRYAAALGKPLAATRPRSTPLPPELADAPIIDPSASTTERIPRLRGVFESFPEVGMLPQPLPPEPPVPYLDVYRTQLDAAVLDQPSQLSIMRDLRSRLVDPGQRAAAWGLLLQLRTRQDVVPAVATTLENLLAPGWHPDPERRMERRYWDGQAWTTLVRHEGREFNERRVQPGSTGPIETVQDLPSRPGRPQRKQVPLRVWVLGGAAVALLVAVGVALAMFVPRLTAADDDPVKTARTFVDAVNVSDLGSLREVICERDRGDAAALYLGDGYRLTLQRVDEDAEQFTVLTTDNANGETDFRTFPLVRDSGQWLVCSP